MQTVGDRPLPPDGFDPANLIAGAVNTNQLFTDAAAVVANAAYFGNFNALLQGLVISYNYNAYNDKAERDADIDPIVGVVGGLGTITADQIKDAMQLDNPLLEDRTGLENSAGVLGATAQLFTNAGAPAAGLDGPTINQLNTLLTQVKVIYADAGNAYATKADRDAAIDGLGIPVAGVAGITAAQLKAAMQTDKELILDPVEAGLVPAVHAAVVDVAHHAAPLTPTQLNVMMGSVRTAIANNPVVNPATLNNRRDGINWVNLADPGHTAAINIAVDAAHPMFTNPGFAVGSNLLNLFVNNVAAHTAESLAFNNLINQVWGIYRDATTGANRIYFSKTRRNMEVDTIADLQGGAAPIGITAAAIKAAWEADAAAAGVNLPDLTPQASTGLDGGTYDAIHDDANITNEQKETLFSSILATAQARPRRVAAVGDADYEGSRNALVEDNVRVALGLAPRPAPVGLQSTQDLIDAINAGLEAWQPAGIVGGINHALSLKPAIMADNVYAAITSFFSPVPDQARPSNTDMNMMIAYLKATMYEARPQPRDLDAFMDLLVGVHNGGVLDWSWAGPWVNVIKLALADLTSGIVNLAINPGIDNNLYDYVVGVPANPLVIHGLALSNAEKNDVLTALFTATTPVTPVHTRLRLIIGALRDVNIRAADPAQKVIIRDLLRRFRNAHPATLPAGAAGVAWHKATVTSVAANGDAEIVKTIPAGGLRKVFLRKNQQQGVPLEVNDKVTISPTTSGAITLDVTGNGLLDWEPHP